MSKTIGIPSVNDYLHVRVNLLFFTNDCTEKFMNTPLSGKLFCNCLKIILVFTVSVQVRFGLGTIGFVKQFHNPELYHYNLLWNRRST